MAEKRGRGVQQEHSSPEAEAGGPHAFWSGTLTFGLVSIPVELYPAVRSSRLPLRTLGSDGQPLRRRYFCSRDERPLEPDEIVRGYELAEDRYVVVGDDELEALEPRKSRDIDLRRFVARDEIDPRLLERPYILAPASESTKAYHLLARVLEQSRRAGVATFVMRGKEYLAVIYAEAGLLHASTLRFADELRTAEDIGEPPLQEALPGPLRAMEAAVRALEKPELAMDRLRDVGAQELLALAERKRVEGRDLVTVAEAPGEPSDDGEVVDIMELLRQRLGPGTPKPIARKPRKKARAGQGRESARRKAKSSKEATKPRRKAAARR